MRGLPKDARVDAGYELYRVQPGREPRHWRPMKSVGPGGAEIRVEGERAYRVLYVARYPEAIYVLHVVREEGSEDEQHGSRDWPRAVPGDDSAASGATAGETSMRMTRGTGNVFRDLGFSREEAQNLRQRSELMIALTDLIERRRWTQALAAKALGVTQPRISDLKRGKLARFSLDMLVQMLNRAGAEVTISVKTRGRHRSKKQAA